MRDLFAHQYGLVTAAQVAPNVLAYRAKTPELERVLPRVYRSTLVPRTLHQTALAAVLWAGEGARASYVTAARVYGLAIAHEKPHVTVPPDRAPKSPLVVVHRALVTGNDRRMRDGIPITSPARTLVDLAGMLDAEELETAVEDFLHRALTTPMSINRCMTTIGARGRAGAGRLKRILDDRGDKALDRKLEVKVWRLLRRHGLKPARQHWVTIAGKRYRLDFAWPALKVAIEAEGWEAHGPRPKFDPDRQRLAALVAAGWSVIPVTWVMCTEHPDEFIGQVKSVLIHAAA